MFQVEADKSKNRLTIHYSQHVGTEEVKRCGERVTALLAELQPGFHLLTDLSGLEAMDFDCARHIKQMMDLCDQKGVSEVVRVIPDPHKDIGFNILSIFHYHRVIRIVTCEKLEDALKILAT